MDREKSEKALEDISDLRPEEHGQVTRVRRPRRVHLRRGFGELAKSRIAATKPTIDRLLRIAIEERTIIGFRYRDKERVAEPHDYGIYKGRARLLVYQIGGSSKGKIPDWRLMDVDLISEVQLLQKTFDGGRRASSGQHYLWDQIYASVTRR